MSIFCSGISKKIVTPWYGAVRLVRRTEEEKYDTVRYGTDIWIADKILFYFYRNTY